MLISLDLETWPFGPGNMLPRPVCMSHASSTAGPALVKGLDSIGRLVRDWLADPSVHLINHSVAFDMGCIAVHVDGMWDPILRAYEAGRILCTERWAQLADYAIGLNRHQYGLWSVADRLAIPHATDESWRCKYHELECVALEHWPREAVQYCLDDARLPLLIAAELPAVPDVAAQTRYAFWLTMSSAFGGMSDGPRVERWGQGLLTRASGLRQALPPGLFHKADKNGKIPRNMKAIQQRVIDAYGGKPPMTDGGKKGQPKPCTDATTCNESPDPVLHTYAEYTETLAAVSRELPILRKPFIHTHYDMAETGRSTSSNPNFQNWTLLSGSRLCLRPREGYVYCIADFGRLELCCIGQLCRALGTGDLLASAIRAGKDPLSMFAATLLGADESDIPQLKRREDWKRTRSCSKGAMYGFPGGMGPASFVSYALGMFDIRLTEHESRVLRQQWRKRWPDVVAYQRKVGDLLEAHCSVCGELPQFADDDTCSCGGELRRGTLDHYRSGRLRGGMRYTQGCNTLFQGLGGDVTKATGWALTKAGYSIAAFVHDEYLIELPIADAPEAALDIRRIMREVGREWLPDAPVDCEPTLATRWIKDDPLYDEGGRLLVIDVDADPKPRSLVSF